VVSVTKSTIDSQSVQRGRKVLIVANDEFCFRRPKYVWLFRSFISLSVVLHQTTLLWSRRNKSEKEQSTKSREDSTQQHVRDHSPRCERQDSKRRINQLTATQDATFLKMSMSVDDISVAHSSSNKHDGGPSSQSEHSSFFIHDRIESFNIPLGNTVRSKGGGNPRQRFLHMFTTIFGGTV
jgi:hypothetical protein